MHAGDAALDALLSDKKDSPTRPEGMPSPRKGDSDSPRLLAAQKAKSASGVRFRAEKLSAAIRQQTAPGGSTEGSSPPRAGDREDGAGAAAAPGSGDHGAGEGSHHTPQAGGGTSPPRSRRTGTTTTSATTPRSTYGKMGFHEEEPRPEWARPWKDKPPPTVDRLISKLTANLEELNEHVSGADKALAALSAKISARIEEEDRILKETENDGL